MQLRYALALLVHRISRIFVVFLLVALLSIQARPAVAASPAFVRIVHASPHIGSADVFLDGTKVLSNFQFGTVTGYVTIPSGPHKVQIALIGKGIGAAVITQTLSVDPGIAYTVAALGANPSDLSLKVFIDNNQLSAGKAKVRVYNLSPGTASVNVFERKNIIVRGLGYPDASNYLTLAAGTYTFNVITTQSNVTLPPVGTTLKVNTVTSLFAVGMINSTPSFQCITAQVQGLPGMPPTGSDPKPNVGPGNSPSLTPWIWLVGTMAILAIGAAVATRRLAHAYRKE